MTTGLPSDNHRPPARAARALAARPGSRVTHPIAPPVHVPIGSIRPSDHRPEDQVWNPRHILHWQFQKLRALLRQYPAFLEDRPLLVRKATMTIYAGNQRYRAAVAEGWTTIPARINDISAVEATRFALLDNQHSGDWVEQELAETLAWLHAQGEDLAALPFDPIELEGLLDSVGLLGDATTPAADDGPDGVQLGATLTAEDGPVPTNRGERAVICPHCGEAFLPSEAAKEAE